MATLSMSIAASGRFEMSVAEGVLPKEVPGIAKLFEIALEAIEKAAEKNARDETERREMISLASAELALAPLRLIEGSA